MVVLAKLLVKLISFPMMRECANAMMAKLHTLHVVDLAALPNVSSSQINKLYMLCLRIKESTYCNQHCAKLMIQIVP